MAADSPGFLLWSRWFLTSVLKMVVFNYSVAWFSRLVKQMLPRVFKLATPKLFWSVDNMMRIIKFVFLNAHK